jgi:hypothetical protein
VRSLLYSDRYIGSEYEFTILTENGPARLVWQTNWRGAQRFECDLDGPVYGGITVNLGELFRRGYVAPESIIAQLRKHNCMQVLIGMSVIYLNNDGKGCQGLLHFKKSKF